MRPSVIALAQHYGVPLSPRSVSGGFQWDGATLGTRYQRWAEVCRCGKCFSLGELELCPTLYAVPERDIVHDIAHHIVAEPWQRDLPEWGLGFSGSFAANGGRHVIGDGIVSDALAGGLWDGAGEADRQEVVTNLIGYILMQSVGVKPPLAWRDRWIEDYTTSAAYALRELPRYGFTEQQGWGALRYMAPRRWRAALPSLRVSERRR